MKFLINTKEELTKILLSRQDEIKKHGVTKLGFFGSFVRNEVSKESDVDFFIEFDPEYKTLKNFISLAALLTELTGRKIEIITPQSLNKFTANYILKEVEYVAIAA